MKSLKIQLGEMVVSVTQLQVTVTFGLIALLLSTVSVVVSIKGYQRGKRRDEEQAAQARELREEQAAQAREMREEQASLNKRTRELELSRRHGELLVRLDEEADSVARDIAIREAREIAAELEESRGAGAEEEKVAAEVKYLRRVETALPKQAEGLYAELSWKARMRVLAAACGTLPQRELVRDFGWLDPEPVCGIVGLAGELTQLTRRFGALVSCEDPWGALCLIARELALRVEKGAHVISTDVAKLLTASPAHAKLIPDLLHWTCAVKSNPKGKSGLAAGVFLAILKHSGQGLSNEVLRAVAAEFDTLLRRGSLQELADIKEERGTDATSVRCFSLMVRALAGVAREFRDYWGRGEETYLDYTTYEKLPAILDSLVEHPFRWWTSDKGYFAEGAAALLATYPRGRWIEDRVEESIRRLCPDLEEQAEQLRREREERRSRPDWPRSEWRYRDECKYGGAIPLPAAA